MAHHEAKKADAVGGGGSGGSGGGSGDDGGLSTVFQLMTIQTTDATTGTLKTEKKWCAVSNPDDGLVQALQALKLTAKAASAASGTPTPASAGMAWLVECVAAVGSDLNFIRRWRPVSSWAPTEAERDTLLRELIDECVRRGQPLHTLACAVGRTARFYALQSVNMK